MSLWWLCYRQSGEIKVVIVEATSLIFARMHVSLAQSDEDASFVEGYELDEGHSALVPARYIGSMLSRRSAATLLDRLERGTKRAAPEERRR
jgi:hypothetical protein